MTLALVLTFAALVLLTTLALLWSSWPGWLKGVLVACEAALILFLGRAPLLLEGRVVFQGYKFLEFI